LPDFRESYFKTMNEYKRWTDKFELPLAMEVVDEPREVPNPWNRTRDDTIRYAEWVKELGFTGFVTFTADSNNGKDYTPIVDYIDIVSVHAWKESANLIKMAKEQQKELWYYNNGMDRFSWGYFVWANQASGRWEWHFSFPPDDSEPSLIGHPNTLEWYTPFTARHDNANYAPFYDRSFKGGMTFRSDFFEVGEGITDYAYLHTLEQAIAKQGAGKPAEAKAARAFLDSLRKVIPPFVDIKGMTSVDDGALVGKGIDTPLAAMSEPWRVTLAKHLTALLGGK
jgi:hypothetical protein